MKRTFKTFLTAVFLISMIHVGPLARVEANMEKELIRYENMTDFVCGVSTDDNQVNTQNQITVKFFNPNEYPVMLNNFLTVYEKKGFAVPELNDRYVNILLSPQRGFQLDCQNMHRLFFDETMQDPSHTKNFMGSIRSKYTSEIEIAMNFKMSPITENYILQESE